MEEKKEYGDRRKCEKEEQVGRVGGDRKEE
jgi:hypothetical protein